MDRRKLYGLEKKDAIGFMDTEKYLHWELTQKIIGCAMEVHNNLGNGFQEVIYQKALAMEMDAIGLSYMREIGLPIIYKGEEIGLRRADFFVEQKVMVELKAVSKLENIHIAQAINYLQVSNTDIGLLINFGTPRLTFKRVKKPNSKNSM
jgi:GxxExxY protein